MKYFCCDELRRQKLKDTRALNGIDFLEVVDATSLPNERRQRTLLVSFVLEDGLSALDHTKLTVEGGSRIRNVRVEAACLATALPAGFLSPAEAAFLPSDAGQRARLLVVRTSSSGDFSRYVLRVVSDATSPDASEPPPGFDPLLSAVEFSFKAGCPSDFDCRPRATCPPGARVRTDINYLAKDYASFRQLMFDRLATLLPSWEERSPADLGVTLVEWLAAIGDQLSYQQDAVATEAYLGTARRRVSLKRHARLVDYAVHDGCNARTWVQVAVTGPSPVVLPKGTVFVSPDPDDAARIGLADFSASRAVEQGRTVFQSMHELVARAAHAHLEFYAWGDARCCLPAGATKATLRRHLPDLAAGDLLVFVEERDPNTGKEADADPARRHAVRLTYARCHPPGHPDQRLEDPLYGEPITEIEWSAGDALPFPFCVSAITDEEHGSDPVANVSVACGNVVLADHGATVEERRIKQGRVETVPDRQRVPPTRPHDSCGAAEPAWRYPAFRPSLARTPLTMASDAEDAALFTLSPSDPAQFAATLTSKIVPPELAQRMDGEGLPLKPGRTTVQGSDPAWSVGDGRTTCLVRQRGTEFEVTRWSWHAAAAATADPGTALPAITLVERKTSTLWTPVRDLLDCTEDDRVFTVETEADGISSIRFGDGVYGMQPGEGAAFDANYRVGNGTAGNVGAGCLRHVVTDESGISGASNLTPAAGGVDAETMEQVRRKAPFAFRVQERAVTPDDYVAAARKHREVQNAVATFRWTGSWHTVFLTIDRKGGLPIDADFRREMVAHLERYRLAGYDLVVDPPRYVSLEIDMLACVAPGYFREDVKEALLDVFTSGRRADGTLGVFHPDRFTFGQPVYLSRIYEAAVAVAGIRSVLITRFQHQGQDVTDARREGRLVLGRLEIARLENDRNYPDHGVLRIEMGGEQ